MAFGTAYFTLSLGANVILTGLIMLRLCQYRRWIKTTLGVSFDGLDSTHARTHDVLQPFERPCARGPIRVSSYHRR